MQAKPAQSFFQRWRWVIIGFFVACAVVLVLAPAASSDPDGLDRVSGDNSFADKAKDPPYKILPDYSIPGVDNEWATVVLSGLVGVGIVFVAGLGFGAFVRHNNRKSDA